ncbi:response regulator [Aquabacter sp. CN5-332]|uniref:hybrid sensor histidine kinase/response regulator n=1 Tax=Aquabacter sp. CN5-332 TaxID=3156608 RepID=UPI0032B5FA02
MNRGAKDELRIRLLAIFREEAADHLRSIAHEMAALEQTPEGDGAQASLDRLFRIVHTLKGAARSLSVRPVEKLCHEIEDLCGEVVQQRAVFDAEAHDVLRDLTECLAAATAQALATPAPSPTAPKVEEPPAPPLPPAAQAAPVPSRPPREAPPERPAPAQPQGPPPSLAVAPVFVRIATDHVQRLGLMAEDLLVPRLAAQSRLEEARRLLAEVSALRRECQSGDVRGEGRATRTAMTEGLRAAEQATRQLTASLAEDTRALRSVADALIVELRRARMMPAGEMLAVFPAMVVDLAREAGKEVIWRAAGADLLIDRQVAELIKDPLIHMVRNAVDHGIEPPPQRVAAGKPAQGTITLSIEPAEGGRVAIELSDDGAGIDLAAVRAAAVRGRLLAPEEAQAMPDVDALDMVFQSSLSTRGVISAVSGRGLGLAIVRERAERLGGTVQLTSRPGAGTVMRLEVPAALANFRGVGVRSGGLQLVWPRDAVERTIGLSAEEYEAARMRGVLAVNGELLPMGDLGYALGQAPSPVAVEGLRSAVLVRHGTRRGVLVVDEVTGECEVVVKELRPPLLRVRNVLAAGLLGTGRLALILRPADVLEALAQKVRRRAAEPRPVRRPGKPRLLIVDDSLTTRAMEMGLLEAAGYEVHAAADGVEAWAALQTRDFDAVVSDVDMPNMDGFELTGRIRADARLRQLPVVLVTALERREDHERGIRLGANAYMMKSAFDQSMLIDLVRRVL